jgi:hypothetical protein
MRTFTRKTTRPTRLAPPSARRELPEHRCRRPDGPENRELRAGGPQDSALYICRCGSAFQATVSASVRCPHCGDGQAW